MGVSLTAEFDRLWRGRWDPGSPFVALPDVLARAAADAIGDVGVGLTVLADPVRRFPVGSSDDVSADVERMQYTLGSGPCFESFDRGAALTASGAEMSTSWPLFWSELRARTPFRSVTAAPLGDGPAWGTMNIYRRDVEPPADATAEAADLAGCISEVLSDDPAFVSLLNVSEQDAHRPDSPGRARSLVWVATGLIFTEARVSMEDALALLRAWAFRRGVQVDELAADIVARRVSVSDELRD